MFYTHIVEPTFKGSAKTMLEIDDHLINGKVCCEIYIFVLFVQLIHSYFVIDMTAE